VIGHKPVEECACLLLVMLADELQETVHEDWIEYLFELKLVVVEC